MNAAAVTSPVATTLDGVIAPSVNVAAGVVVGFATDADTPLDVTTEKLVTVPDPPPPLPLAAAVILPLESTVIFAEVYDPGVTAVLARVVAIDPEVVTSPVRSPTVMSAPPLPFIRRLRVRVPVFVTVPLADPLARIVHVLAVLH
jgi:hypothetical protein